MGALLFCPYHQKLLISKIIEKPLSNFMSESTGRYLDDETFKKYKDLEDEYPKTRDEVLYICPIETCAYAEKDLRDR